MECDVRSGGFKQLEFGLAANVALEATIPPFLRNQERDRQRSKVFCVFCLLRPFGRNQISQDFDGSVERLNRE